MSITLQSAKIIQKYILDNSIYDQDIDNLIIELHLEQPSDKELAISIIDIVKEDKNSTAINNYKNGKHKAIGPIVGQVMKKHRGADPQWINEMIKEAIDLIDIFT